MATATVHWLNERNFVGVDSTGHSVVLSGQKNGIGVSPSQMLLVALASCSSVDVVEILEKKAFDTDVAGSHRHWGTGAGSALDLSQNPREISAGR